MRACDRGTPPSQILALRVYNVLTVSTISRPRLLGADHVYRLQTTLPGCTGKRWNRTNIGTLRLQHADSVYN